MKKVLNKKAAFLLILVFYLFSRIAYIDKFPSVRVDEVWYTQQAYTFIHEGRFATPFWGDWMGVDKVAYMIMPVFSLTAILFFKLLGFGYVVGRLVSVMYGFLAIIVVYFLGKKVRDEKTGIIAAGIMAVDTLFFFETRQIRPEAPVVFFSSLGALLFLMAATDKKNNAAKYFFSGVSLALAVFSHPVGALVAASIFLYLAMNKKILQKETLYILAGIAVPSAFYALYALMDINTFLLQAEVNWVRAAPGVYQSPFIERIFTEPSRYIHYLFRYKSFTFFALAAAALVYARRFRDEKTTFIKYLAITPLLLFFFVAGKSHWYLSAVLPYFAVLVSLLVAGALKEKQSKAYALILLLFALHIAYSLGGEAYIVRQNNGFDYNSLCEKLRPDVRGNAVVLGTPQFWFCFADKKFYTIEIIERLAVVGKVMREEIITKYKPEYYLVDEDFITNYMDPEFRAYLEGIMKEGQKITELTDPVYGKVTLYRGPYYAG